MDPKDPNVFLSWSGERSGKVADALYDWIPCVIQAAIPWKSDFSIAKGTQGLLVLTDTLRTMRVAIAVLTPRI